VEIEMLSRFRAPKQQKAILAGMAEGKIDIVVATHRLLQKDVKFQDLGLLILDEEHRFGVRQKESLKQIRTAVDVLTLSATPIPRTLQMSLLGLRDLSSIKTPPQDRRAIETFIVPFEHDIIREAVMREIERGGQVFIVHNQVYDIETFADRIREIVPEARIGVAHGQMAERGLERVMLDFVKGKCDTLVCTTIIESGLDIPNANTMLVHRADRLGLAQLYQLRGRVGRSERQAYTYLIVPDEQSLAGEARKRLEALYEFTELGSGFRIARHDLEIRGAGNLLGANQSGHIRAIGYDLYVEMLEKAIRQLRGEEFLEEVDPEIHLELPAHLPDDYLEDSTQRLSFYKRLAKAREDQEVDRIRAEMQDRFGTPPPQAETLFKMIRIKVVLRRLRVREARLAEEGLMLTFDPQTSVSIDRILAWAQQEPDRLRLFPNDRVLIRFSVPDPEERLKNIQQILDWFEQEPGQQKVTDGKNA
jgi:transcription-repair coupling factor (superfamily II helicase)